MTKGGAQSFESLLSCGCVRVFSPIPEQGDRVHCTRHPDSVCTVVEVSVGAWRVRCAEPKCRYGKRAGASETRARELASAHAIRRVGHLVTLYRSDVPQYEIGAEGQQELWRHPVREAQEREKSEIGTPEGVDRVPDVGKRLPRTTTEPDGGTEVPPF